MTEPKRQRTETSELVYVAEEKADGKGVVTKMAQTLHPLLGDLMASSPSLRVGGRELPAAMVMAMAPFLRAYELRQLSRTKRDVFVLAPYRSWTIDHADSVLMDRRGFEAAVRPCIPEKVTSLRLIETSPPFNMTGHLAKWFPNLTHFEWSAAQDICLQRDDAGGDVTFLSDPEDSVVWPALRSFLLRHENADSMFVIGRGLEWLEAATERAADAVQLDALALLNTSLRRSGEWYAMREDGIDNDAICNEQIQRLCTALKRVEMKRRPPHLEINALAKATVLAEIPKVLPRLHTLRLIGDRIDAARIQSLLPPLAGTLRDLQVTGVRKPPTAVAECKQLEVLSWQPAWDFDEALSWSIVDAGKWIGGLVNLRKLRMPLDMIALTGEWAEKNHQLWPLLEHLDTGSMDNIHAIDVPTQLADYKTFVDRHPRLSAIGLGVTLLSSVEEKHLEQLGALKLTALGVNNNGVNDLPSMAARLACKLPKTLTALRLADVELDRAFVRDLGQRDQLRRLTLEGCSTSKWDEAVWRDALPKSLPALETLEIFHSSSSFGELFTVSVAVFHACRQRLVRFKRLVLDEDVLAGATADEWKRGHGFWLDLFEERNDATQLRKLRVDHALPWI